MPAGGFPLVGGGELGVVAGRVGIVEDGCDPVFDGVLREVTPAEGCDPGAAFRPPMELELRAEPLEEPVREGG